MIKEIEESTQEIIEQCFEKREEKIEKRIDVDETKLEQENKNEIPTRNSALEGEEHPQTGVKFERKEVETSEGIKEGVFPKFEEIVGILLPEDLYLESDRKQFNFCNEELKSRVEDEINLREQFSEEQLEQIMFGETPDGYTWHHTEDIGKMQLVDYDIHRETGHTGGRSIWGGGTECR